MWTGEGLGDLDGHRKEEPAQKYKRQELRASRSQEGKGWEGAGRTATSVPAPPATVSPRPLLSPSARGTDPHRQSWRLGPGLGKGSGFSGGSREGGETRLPLDTSRSGPRRQAGPVVRKRKDREASAERNQDLLANCRLEDLHRRCLRACALMWGKESAVVHEASFVVMVTEPQRADCGIRVGA